MIRRLAVLGVGALLVAQPARAANKDIERLQIQIASLQGQVSDLQRTAEDNLKEVRRLNELLAEQNAFFRKSLQDQRVQDEALQTTLKEVAERLGELGERFQAMQAQATAAASASPYAPMPGMPGATGVPGTQGAPAAPEGPGGIPPTGAPPSPLPAPRELYSQAYADFARGNYDLAIQEFTEYLRSYPSTDFSDNAQYWIGECHYGKQKYAEAIEAWNTLFRDYSASDKLPDARVKKGMALERLGRRSQALVEYRYVVERYPNSPAARIARERLNP